MKYLTLEDYFKPSPSITLAGLTEEQVKQRFLECTTFLEQLDTNAKNSTKVLCIAINILCLYCRKFSFDEFDRYLACGVAHFLASKICYNNKHNIDWYKQYCHMKKPLPKPMKGKKAVTAVAEYTEQVKEKLHQECMQIEIDMLTTLGFDFEFELAFDYIRFYFNNK